MDWFSWLSKTGVEPTLVYDYALAFSENELEEEDIPHFNHEFLQSMGISIAKHRLEILKLAKKEKGGKKQIMRLFVAIKKTKNCLVKYIHSLVHRENSSSSTILMVPRGNSYSSRWKMAMLKRNKKLMMSKQGRFLITNSGYSSNPLMVQDYATHDQVQDKKDVEFEKFEDQQVKDESNWSSGVEEIKWDAMFQNLNPT